MGELGGHNGNPRDALAHLNAAGTFGVGTFQCRNLPRQGLYDSAGDTGQVALATGVMTTVPIQLRQNDVITSLTAVSGQTAAGTPTAYWFALYSPAGTLIAQTANQGSAAWAANTAKTLPLSAPQTIGETGIYFVGIMVAATTPPSLLGTIGGPAVVTGERNLSQSSGSSLTTTAPATIATPTAKPFIPYVVAS